MNVKKALLTWLLLVFVYFDYAQDTIKVLQYNLLNYGNNTSYCDQNNNNLDVKNENLRTLFSYITPDIISVNEMVNDDYKATFLLTNVLNSDGRTFYRKAAMTNLSGSDIVNMLYYNSDKFTLDKQEAISTSLRDINVYYLYYNSPDLQTGDTAWITCFVAHLKAGSYSSDAATRDQMTATMMNYIKNHDIDGNVLIMGDFNLYSSSEAAYQNMVNYSVEKYRVYDPVNMPGDWSNNSYYRMYHSQSTHYASDCFAGGGLDDRFDFILISEEIRDGLDKIQYLPNSFKVIGQDGNHFNSALTDAPTNSLYPDYLIQALYKISDHLPVTMKLVVDQTPAMGVRETTVDNNVKISTLVYNEIKVESEDNFTYILLDITGKVVLSGKGERNFSISVNNLSEGLYFLKLENNTKKIVKKVMIVR